MLQLAVGWWCDNPCMSSRVSRFICLFWVVNQQCEQRLADTPRRWVTRPRPLDFSEFLFLCQCPSGCKRQWSYGRVFHVFFHSINSPRWNWYGSLCQKALFFSTWSQDLFTFTIPPQDTGFHDPPSLPFCQKPRWYASERHWSWQALLSGST